jgi:hypothetical protein
MRETDNGISSAKELSDFFENNKYSVAGSNEAIDLKKFF